MVNFRYFFKDLKEFARKRGTVIYSTPRGFRWERLKETGEYSTKSGIFRLEREKPTILITYGDSSFLITKDFIEISIPEEEVAGVDTTKAPLEVWVGFRLALFLGSFGMTPDIKKTFVRVRRSRWEKGTIVGVDRRVVDTDTLSQFPAFYIYVYPDWIRFLRFVYFRPRMFTIEELEIEIARIFGITRAEARGYISKALLEKYIEEVDVRVWVKVPDHLVVTQIVSENEGVFTFSGLWVEMRKYGIGRRRAISAIFKAEDEGLIEYRKTPAYYRYFTTDKGKEELKKIKPYKIEKRVIITRKGIDEIGF